MSRISIIIAVLAAASLTPTSAAIASEAFKIFVTEDRNYNPDLINGDNIFFPQNGSVGRAIDKIVADELFGRIDPQGRRRASQFDTNDAIQIYATLNRGATLYAFPPIRANYRVVISICGNKRAAQSGKFVYDCAFKAFETNIDSNANYKFLVRYIYLRAKIVEKSTLPTPSSIGKLTVEDIISCPIEQEDIPNG